MRLAFYRSRVDGFKPFDNNIKYYDINSLYLFSMLKYLPVGKPVLSDDTNLDNFFGIIYIEVETPKNKKSEYIKLKYLPLPFKDEKGNLINPISK